MSITFLQIIDCIIGSNIFVIYILIQRSITPSCGTVTQKLVAAIFDSVVHAVKAPNFDRVFMKNNIYSILLLDDHPLKRLTGRVKSSSLKSQNGNSYSEIQGDAKIFSEDVEVTIQAANLDRYKYFVTLSCPTDKSVWQVGHEQS